MGADGPRCTPNVEYEVYALAVFEGIALVQLIDDLGFPAWLPVWFFEIVDASMPADWMCSFFHTEPTIVMGPTFVSGSVDDYVAMVELGAQHVDLFWERVHREKSPAGS